MSKTDPVERASIELAALVEEERALLARLADVRAEKAAKRAEVQQAVVEALCEPSSSGGREKAPTDRQKLRKRIVETEPDTVLEISKLAEELFMKPNSASAYMSAFVKEGIVIKDGR